MRMRILKTVQSYFPFEERGGTVFKVRAIARGLARRGHQVTILTADLGIEAHNSNGMFEACEWGWRHAEPGVETIYVPTLARYRALTVNRRVIRFCGASVGRFDLVHVYGLYDLFGPAAGQFCRRQGIPYVVEPMGMYRPIIRNIALKKLHRGLFGRRLAAGARFVIATSEQERRELLEAGIEASRVEIRRNGIELPEVLPARGEFRRRWNMPAEAKLVLFLGRVVSKKRPDLLIGAFADWKTKGGAAGDSILVLAGPAEEERYVSSLKSLAHSLGVSEQIVFFGPLFGGEKWQAYRDADVFVLPSENENFGNTAAESAACGTPVIVTDRCGVAPFLERAGLIVPLDRTQIAEALGRILNDAEFAERCRQGCADVARQLSWDSPLEECDRLYQRCLAAPARQQVVTGARK
jgi:glycosyltransferase involved in cell wall biosynthesis